MDIKRIFTLLLAALCLASFLTACSEEQPVKDESSLTPPVFESEEEASVETSEESSEEAVFNAADITDFTPYISLGKYMGVTVYREKVTDVLVDKTIKEMLKKIAEYKEMPEGTAAALGDVVTIDYEGYRLDTMEQFNGGTAQDVALELGSGQFIDGFEDGIVGHKVGDKFDVLVTFPEKYHNSEYAGMDAKFTITLKKITSPDYPKLTDEVAKKLNYTSVDALNKAVIAALELDLEEKNMTKAWKEVMDAVAVKSYPEGSIEQYTRQYVEFNLEQYEYNAAKIGLELDVYLKTYYGTTEEEFRKSLAESAKNYAETSVKQNLVMYAIADAEFGRKISDEERQQHIERYAEKEGMSVEQLLQHYSDEVITENILWDKVMILIYDAAVKTDIPLEER